MNKILIDVSSEAKEALTSLAVKNRNGGRVSVSNYVKNKIESDADVRKEIANLKKQKNASTKN